MADTFLFTILHDPAIGFTNALYQFNSLYKLGRAAGGSYVHSPFTSRRSPPGVFRFLGFNRAWPDSIKQPRFADKKIIKFPISDELLARDNIQTFEDLVSYVRLNFFKACQGPPDSFVAALIQQGGRNFFHLITAALTERPEEYPVRPAYEAARQRQVKRMLWQPHSLRILVHIRQGDTATIQTPWHTYIPLRPFGKNRYKELRHPGAVEIYIPPRNFLDFLNQLQAQLLPGSYSACVFSDGYKAGFADIYAHWRRLHLSLWRWVRLKFCEINYDRKMFSEFRGLPGVRCVIGESDNNLYDLIQACLTADIIVMGTQQRMLLKLLLMYHDVSHPKIIIVLNPDEKVEHYAALYSLPAEKRSRQSMFLSTATNFQSCGPS